VFARPQHPYTIALLSAARVPDARIERTRTRIILRGDLPDPANPPTGCRFRTRCWHRERLGDPAICSTDDPALTPVAGGTSDQLVACHFPADTSGKVMTAASIVAEVAPTLPETRP
jgi:peptide/nickel transport system ATP-binding protein